MNPRATLTMVVLVRCLGGCGGHESAEERRPTAEAPTSRDASPPIEPRPDPGPAASIDCGAVLTEADLRELCVGAPGALVLATPTEDLDDLGPDRTCSRRFSDGGAGSLAIMLMRKDAPGPLSTVEPAWTHVAALTGIGDEARSYQATSRGGDAVYKLELRKGDVDVLIFTSSLAPGSEPCVRSLEAVARRLAERLP